MIFCKNKKVYDYPVAYDCDIDKLKNEHLEMKKALQDIYLYKFIPKDNCELRMMLTYDFNTSSRVLKKFGYLPKKLKEEL